MFYNNLPLVIDISVTIMSSEIPSDQDLPTERHICWHRVYENHEKNYQRNQL